MVGEFNSFYSQDKQAKSNDVNLTPYQVIILASIVEGEARVSDERSIIAGLYLNRIKKVLNLKQIQQYNISFLMDPEDFILRI